MKEFSYNEFAGSCRAQKAMKSDEFANENYIAELKTLHKIEKSGVANLPWARSLYQGDAFYMRLIMIIMIIMIIIYEFVYRNNLSACQACC